MYVCVYITESLSCTPEINTTLYTHYTSKQVFKHGSAEKLPRLSALKETTFVLSISFDTFNIFHLSNQIRE